MESMYLVLVFLSVGIQELLILILRICVPRGATESFPGSQAPFLNVSPFLQVTTSVQHTPYFLLYNSLITIQI
jgi:hypothetical protein